MRRFAAGALALLLARSAYAGGPSARLNISVEPARVSVGQQVRLLIQLENENAGYIVIFPLLMPAEVVNGTEPWCRVELAVRDELGHTIKTANTSEPDKIRMPQPADFVVLPPGYLFGRRVPLAGGAFSVSFPRSGVYSIKATLRSTARSWLQLKKSEGAAIPYELDRVLEGEIESNTVILTISP